LNSEVTGLDKTVIKTIKENTKERLTAPMETRDESFGFFIVKKIIRTNDSIGKNGINQLYGNI
jgi:hypothetical protein